MSSTHKPIYLIAGDAFMRRAEYDSLIAQLKSSATGTCDLQSFDVTDTPMNQILSAARSLPFLVDSQILRVKQADRLKEDGLSELEGYLKSPFDKTVLIFEADKADEKSRLAKLAHEYGLVIRPVSADRMKREVQFLRARLAEEKKTITPEAQKQILDMCGEAPMFLESMIDRLILFAGDKTQIDGAMVAQFDEDWTEVRIFDLSDAILARDSRKALHVLRKLFEMEDDIYSMLGFIHSQIKKLWQAKILIEEGSAPSQIAVRLGMKSSYVSGNFFRGLEKFQLAKLETAIDELHQLDRKSKTGRVTPVAALEMWLLRLTAPTASPLQGRGRN
jgi:DNA polymerase III subunit delta